MTHEEKVAHFCAHMGKRGIQEGACAPPAWKLAWRLGWTIPPPHFVGFLPLALVMGLLFGVLWGFAMWLLYWSSQGWRFSVSAAAYAGALFGLSLAGYYRYSASKHNLPSWEQYPKADLLGDESLV
jgi:hypothetical protein